jgi:hypothetical protein
MRRSFAFLALAVFIACSGGRTANPVSEPASFTPIDDLTFQDPQLQLIATRLLREAERRGITEVAGRWNRVECLIALESELGAPPVALERVNALALRLTTTDMSSWAKTRGEALARCEGRRDAACERVTDMLQRWHRHKLQLVTEHLSDERRVYLYGSREWERHFYEFVRSTPMDAATWGWIVSTHRRELSSVDGEAAYQYYLDTMRLGKSREAAYVFSVPGVRMKAEATPELATRTAGWD